MTLDEYIKEQRERVANMTLAQARQIVANHYGHDDMRIECEKAVWMLLNCADEKINGGWIPVTERLPENGGRYLVSCSSGYVTMTYYYELAATWSPTTIERIVAWMPLPEPYNGGK